MEEPSIRTPDQRLRVFVSSTLAELARRTWGRTREMGLTMMGGTYALGIADLYRRAGQPSLASALLRHAMTLINPTIQSAEYARAKQQMAALADVGEETV